MPDPETEAAVPPVAPAALMRAEKWEEMQAHSKKPEVLLPAPAAIHNAARMA